MVASAEGGAEVLVGEAGEFASEIHGDLAREDEGGGAFAADHVAEADVKVVGHALLDALDGHDVLRLLGEEVAQEFLRVLLRHFAVEGNP